MVSDGADSASVQLGAAVASVERLPLLDFLMAHAGELVTSRVDGTQPGGGAHIEVVRILTVGEHVAHISDTECIARLLSPLQLTCLHGTEGSRGEREV